MIYNAILQFGFLFLIQILSSSSEAPLKTKSPDYEWDVLIFTQRWPLTACSEWREKNKNNSCSLPDLRDLWTIHGIWPTKPGTRGPENCNKSWHFNDTLIEPIKAQLEEYWTNVEKNTKLDSLWQHEWMKHGTCAAALPQLNNELNYFKKGLEWIHRYNMKTVLSQKQVVPNEQGYPVQQIFDSVQLVLSKSPIIQCIIDKDTKQSLISEIRICFNKNLDLMDCDTVKEEDFIKIANVLTNCNIQKPVMYPNKVETYTTSKRSRMVPTNTVPKLSMANPQTPTMSTFDSLYNTRESLITAYRTIKLLMWATL